MTKKLKELIGLQNKLDEEIKLKQNTLRKVRQKIVDIVCPHKVGDRLRNKIGNVVEVSSIVFGYGHTDWKMRGCKIKKDGTVGTREVVLYDFEDWKKT